VLAGHIANRIARPRVWQLRQEAADLAKPCQAEQKKGPTVAGRALEVWERMPERHDLYGEIPELLQVRRVQLAVHFLQSWAAIYYRAVIYELNTDIIVSL
jgi:hypothetical protein